MWSLVMTSFVLCDQFANDFLAVSQKTTQKISSFIIIRLILPKVITLGSTWCI